MRLTAALSVQALRFWDIEVFAWLSQRELADCAVLGADMRQTGAASQQPQRSCVRCLDDRLAVRFAVNCRTS